jgi:hypothetical protein
MSTAPLASFYSERTACLAARRRLTSIAASPPSRLLTRNPFVRHVEGSIDLDQLAARLHAARFGMASPSRLLGDVIRPTPKAAPVASPPPTVSA